MVKGISWNRGSDRERRLTLSIIVYLGNTSKTLSLNILLALQARIVSFSLLSLYTLNSCFAYYIYVCVGGWVCMRAHVCWDVYL